MSNLARCMLPNCTTTNVWHVSCTAVIDRLELYLCSVACWWTIAFTVSLAVCEYIQWSLELQVS
jgi:hypothetical protein